MPDDDDPLTSVDIIVEDERWDSIAGVAALISSAARALRERPELGREGAVNVLLASDAEIAELNQQFRGKAGPTNVLSFPSGGGAEPRELGDIALAYETIVREAAEQGTPVEHHLQHLVVHGILHLMGYDHDTAPAAERMEALEIEVLSMLGIANPYTGVLESDMNT